MIKQILPDESNFQKNPVQKKVVSKKNAAVTATKKKIAAKTTTVTSGKSTDGLEDIFNALFDSTVNSTILIAPNFDILYFNAAAKAFTKVLINKELRLGESMLNYIQSGKTADFKMYFATALSGVPVKIETENLNSKGASIWLQANYTPAFDKKKHVTGIVLNAIDITDKKQYENKLTQVNKIFNHSLDMLCTAGLDGFFKTVNPECTKRLGWSSEELLSRPIIEFIHPDDRVISKNNRSLVLQGIELKSNENRYLCKDGSVKWLSWRAHFDEQDHIIIGVARDITERKKELEAIERSENKYSTLIEQAYDGIIIYDLSGTILQFNDKAANFLGYNKEEFAKLKLTDLFFKEELVERPINFNRLKEGLSTMDNRRLKRKDGTAIEMEINSKMLPDNTILVFGRDIAARKKLEYREQSRASILEMVSKNTALEEVLLAIVESAERDEPGLICSILILDKTGKRFVQSIASSLPDFYNAATLIVPIRIGAGSCGTAAATGQRVIVDNIKTHPDWQDYRDLASQAGLAACWSEPIKDTDGKVLATFAIYNKEVSTPTNQQTEFIKQFADLTSIVLNKSIADQQLKHANELLEETSHVARLGGYEIDMETGIISSSTAIREIYEVDNYAQITIENGINFYKEGFDRDTIRMLADEAVNKGIPFDTELQIVTAKGNVRWVRSKAKVEFKDGKCTRLFGTMQDIHERKLIEEALVKSEEKFRSLIYNISDVIIIMNDVGKVMYESASVTRVMGYLEGEIIGQNVFELIHPDDVYIVGNALSNGLLVSGSAPSIEFRFLHKSGHYIYLEVQGNNQLENPSINGIIVVARDISDRKKNEALLAEKELYYRKLVQFSTSALLLTDANGTILYQSPAVEKIGGYPIEENDNNSSIFNYIHPDDADAFMQQFKGLLNDALTSISGEYRFLHQQGHYLWIEGTASNYLQEESVQAIIINFKDITERKIAEEKIRTERSLLRTLIDNLPHPIYVKDLEGKKLIANKEDIFFMGLQQETDALGKTDLDLFPSQMGHAGHYADLNTMKKGVPLHNLEEMYFDINDYQRWLLVSKIPLKNTDEQVIGLLGIGRDITNQKENNQLLIDAENRYRALVENSTDGVAILAENGVPTYISPSIQKILGYTEEEAKSMNAFSITHPDDIVAVEKVYAAAFEKPGIPMKGSTSRMLHKDGSWRWLEDTVTSMFHVPAIGGFVENFRDITEQRLIENKIIVEKEISDAIINSLPGIFFIFDRDGKFIRWNKNFEIITGYNAEEIAHMHPLDFHLAEQKEMLEQRIAATGKSNLQEFEAILFTKDKKEIPFYLSLMFLNHPDVNHMICLGFDISNSKKQEKHLNTLNQHLEKREEALINSNNELERFAYVASHDLQEPLRMVASFLKLLENKYGSVLDETAKRYIYFAVDGASRMKGLINDLLEYSKVSTNKEVTGNTDMAALMKELLATFVVTKEELGATIEVGEMPVLKHTRKLLLLQLFQNLISNALKYHSTEKPVIKINAKEEEANWLFSIEDNGIGINPVFAQKIFVIFQRLHVNDQFSGTGIGLSICKKIVELHGGQIWVESAEGKGSIFYFTIEKQL